MEERSPYLPLQLVPHPDMKECLRFLQGLVCPFSYGMGNADQRKHSYTDWCWFINLRMVVSFVISKIKWIFPYKQIWKSRISAGSCFLLSLLVPTPLGIGRKSSTSRITSWWGNPSLHSYIYCIRFNRSWISGSKIGIPNFHCYRWIGGKEEE